MEFVQAALILLFAVVALLGLLFVSLVAGLAMADRARATVPARRSASTRRYGNQ